MSSSTSMKHPKDYSIDEVCIWLNGIGLGDKVVNTFRESSIDGNFLTTFKKGDLKELGLTNIQCKKLFYCLEKTISFTAGSSSGGGDPADHRVIQELQVENNILRIQVDELQDVKTKNNTLHTQLEELKQKLHSSEQRHLTNKKSMEQELCQPDQQISHHHEMQQELCQPDQQLSSHQAWNQNVCSAWITYNTRARSRNERQTYNDSSSKKNRNYPKVRACKLTDQSLMPNGKLSIRLRKDLSHLPKRSKRSSRCAFHNWSANREKQGHVLYCEDCNVFLCIHCYQSFHKIPNVVDYKEQFRNIFLQEHEDKKQLRLIKTGQLSEEEDASSPVLDYSEIEASIDRQIESLLRNIRK